MKIVGEHNEVIIEDATIENIVSYGSIIDNESINVFLYK